MTDLVVDASAVVAVLTEPGAPAEWITSTLRGVDIAAPTVMPFEVGGVLRRRERSGQLHRAAAALAHRRLRAMGVDLWPHSALAQRAWELRDSATYDDACFVALAELLDAPMITFDLRLTITPAPAARS